MSSYVYCEITSNADMNNNTYAGFEYYFVDASSGSITITLPEILYDGTTFIMHRIDNSVNNVTLEAFTGQTVDGTSSVNMPARNYQEFVSLNNNWYNPNFSY